MKYVYHGSKKQGLKELYPKKSTHQKEWVYAMTSKELAVIFISNHGSDLNYYLGGKGTKDSPIILVERKEGMFKQIFNTSGSLYTLDGKNFIKGKTSWSAEVVSESNEFVIKEEKIENVYSKLIELDKKGE